MASAVTTKPAPTPTPHPQRRMHSILRRKRAPSQSREPPASQTLRHSLSLPDLTTPLIDADAWEELPTFFSPPTEPNGPTKGKGGSGVGGSTAMLTRGRKPSLIGAGNIQFHKPFRVDSLNPPMSAPSTHDGKGDFRLPFARWARDANGDEEGVPGAGGRQTGRRAEFQDRTMSVVSRRRGRKANALGRLNVVVAGGKGVGKTSFINMLVHSLDTSSSPSARSTVGSPSKRQPSSPTVDATTPSAPTSPGAPRNIAQSPVIAPTTRLYSRVATASLPDMEKTQLRIIDTPGLELGTEALAAKERDRGVRGLLRMIEARFEETLREESKVIRTKPRADDDVVHLLLYLIDAGQVLRPPQDSADVDWSGAGLFDDAVEPGHTNACSPHLSTSDIDTIRRLSERCNVLPILTQIDALTVSQLDVVRTVVRRDLAKAMPEAAGRGFGIFLDEDEPESGDDTNEEASPAGAPPSPSPSGTSEESTPLLPYALFSAESISAAANGMERRFAWGAADVLNPKHSDFGVLREAILGTYIKALRTNTREVLYERFRTERLLAKRASGR